MRRWLRSRPQLFRWTTSLRPLPLTSPRVWPLLPRLTTLPCRRRPWRRSSATRHQASQSSASSSDRWDRRKRTTTKEKRTRTNRRRNRKTNRPTIKTNQLLQRLRDPAHELGQKRRRNAEAHENSNALVYAHCWLSALLSTENARRKLRQLSKMLKLLLPLLLRPPPPPRLPLLLPAILPWLSAVARRPRERSSRRRPRTKQQRRSTERS